MHLDGHKTVTVTYRFDQFQLDTKAVHMSVDIKSVSAGATHLVSKLGPRFPPGLAATKKATLLDIELVQLLDIREERKCL